MSDGAQTNPSLDRSEHIDENVSAKRVGMYVWDGSNWQRSNGAMGKLVTVAFDYVGYANTDTITDTYTYKTGGSGGATVATVTVVYTDTTKTQPLTITRT